MDLHAEDRYNFNPDNEDITTGIPDSANGRFEVTGLGHQYENHSTLRRILTWKGIELGVTSATQPGSSRARQSADNYRLRNRF